jgi:hypothetical protein
MMIALNVESSNYEQAYKIKNPAFLRKSRVGVNKKL